MINKLVQTTAQIVGANKQIYSTITTTVSTPVIISNETNIVPLNTSVETTQIFGTVVNMGEEVFPNPSLFKRINDSYQTLDILKLNYKLVKLDTVPVSDTVNTQTNYRRVFTELKITSDSYKVFVVNKILLETKTFTDVLNKRFNKALLDTFTKADLIKVVYGKSLLDAVTNTEKLNLNYNKIVNDNTTNTELVTKTANFNRSFVEFVDATDDFYGLANLDDDQIAKVNKVVADWIASTEIQSIVVTTVKTDTATTLEQKLVGLTKPFSDVGNTTDIKSLQPQKVFVDVNSLVDIKTIRSNKVLLDTSTTLDVSNKRSGKTLLDSLITQEQTHFNSLKLLNDNFSASDSIQKTWLVNRLFIDSISNSELLRTDVIKAVQDTAATLDIPILSTSKILINSFSNTDILSRIVDYKRNFLDIIAATDDFYGTANIDDDQIAFINKVLVDPITNTELLQFAVVVSKVDLASILEQKAANLTKPFSDVSGISDSKSLQPQKVFLDVNNLVDTKAIGTNKVLIDTSTTLDVSSKDATKLLLDVFNAQEQFQFSNLKPLSNNFSASDSIQKTWLVNRLFIDSISNSELLRTDVIKALQDTADTLDIPRLSTSKILINSFSNTDILSRIVDYKRNFLDVIAVTDDFYGTANIDDDQIAFINKVVVDPITNTELLQFAVVVSKVDLASILEQKAANLTKPFSDVSGISDSKSLQPQKVFLDVNNLVDTKAIGTNKVLIDTSTTLDVSSKDATKLLLDVFNAQEQFQFSSLKPLSDNFNTSDSIVKIWSINPLVIDSISNSELLRTDIIKALQDTADTLDIPRLSTSKILINSFSNTDTLSQIVDYKRNFLDVIAVTDDFYGTANIDDDQIAFINKVVVDFINYSELLELNSSKILSDSVTLNQDVEFKNILLSKLELANTSDVINFYKFANRFNNELIAANDSGFINTQNYFTEAYVEPGYVGNNTYFS